jgi:hypothetical protein
MSSYLTITIAGKESAKFKKRLEQEARSRGWSLSEMCVEALADYLRQMDPIKPGGTE